MLQGADNGRIFRLDGPCLRRIRVRHRAFLGSLASFACSAGRRSARLHDLINTRSSRTRKIP